MIVENQNILCIQMMSDLCLVFFFRELPRQRQKMRKLETILQLPYVRPGELQENLSTVLSIGASKVRTGHPIKADSYPVAIYLVRNNLAGEIWSD